MQHVCFKMMFHMFQFHFTLTLHVIKNAIDAHAHDLGMLMQCLTPRVLHPTSSACIEWDCEGDDNDGGRPSVVHQGEGGWRRCGRV
jgi:hypothetical protein